MNIWKQGYTGVYSFLIVLFGAIYKNMASVQTYKENYRYQKDYDDTLIFRLFLFNWLNFYVPMLLVAFYRQNYTNLFIMMLIQMGLKQFTRVVLGWIKPWLMAGKKLDNIKKEFRHITDLY